MSSLTVRPSQTSHWPTDTMAVPIKNVVTTGISKVALTETECAEDGWEGWKVGGTESGRGRMRSESLNLSGHGLIALLCAPHLTLAHPPTRASPSRQSNFTSLFVDSSRPQGYMFDRARLSPSLAPLRPHQVEIILAIDRAR